MARIFDDKQKLNHHNFVMNSEKTGLRLSSVLFGLFAIAHVIRLINQNSGAGGQSPDPDGSKLGGAHHCSDSLHLVLATGFGQMTKHEC